jgi:hypothetical protein
MPISLARRLELSALLYAPPKMEELGARLAALSPEVCEAVLHEIAPLVQASHSGERERAAFFELASLAAVPSDRAQQLLAG